ncbi:MAG: DNA/RNA nuclease SfsA [Fidelibacterota bacterium]
MTESSDLRLPWKLIPATFIERPNRFLTVVEIDGQEHESHLPDPGRLKELLLPGVRVLVKRESGAHRKTRFSTQAVYLGETLISVNSWLPNMYVEHLIKGGHLPWLSEWWIEKREFTVQHSRFDFLLKKKSDGLLLEVKSVTLVENSVAKFPDAVTERGARHLNHLAELSRNGQKCMVLFVVQREDAMLFRPQWERDPALGQALVNADESGTDIRVIKMKMTTDRLIYLGELPWDLTVPKQHRI